jgi:hypothetical protein
MISQERKVEIEHEATTWAEAASEDALRREAATAMASLQDVNPNSDQRVEFEIKDRAYTREMIRRGLSV